MAARKTSDIAGDMLTDCAAGRVRQISRVITAHYDDALRGHGVTANQLTILCLLSALGPCRSVDLEPYLASDQSTLSRSLSRMTKNGWLRKVADADGRATRLTLTATGEAMIRKCHGDWRKAQDWAETLLSPQGVKNLKKVAKAVNPLLP